MEIVVCMKQVVDLQQIRIKRDTREAVTQGLPYIFGEMDKNALEEAIQIKERIGGKVSVLSIGAPKLKDTVKEALAAGADQAFLFLDPSYETTDASLKANILAKALQKIGQYDLILLGEGSADNYSGQTGPRLAQIIGLPIISYAKKLEFFDGNIKCTRDEEQYFEVVETRLPAIVTITSGINQPRIPSLAQILRASKKPITEWKLADVGFTVEQLKEKQVALTSNLAPIEQRKGVIFEGASDENITNFVNAMKKEGVLGS
jgi:electron transfer flavoprotein beta subunit